MLKFNRLIQFLYLIFTISILSHFAVTQSTTEKDDRNKNPMSLEGLTEAILIDGQPALRILSRKSGSIEIRFEKRDGEDALVFIVTRLKSFGFGVQPADEGKLYVTKNRVTYVPYLDKEGFFNALVSEIQNIELKKVGQGFETINFMFQNDKKRFIFNGTVFINGSVWSGVRFNKKDLHPSLQFLLQALKAFNSTLLEFNKLTASVRSSDEDEEIEDEKTEVDVNETRCST